MPGSFDVVPREDQETITHGITTVSADLGIDEGRELAKRLEDVPDDLVVLDLDAETVLQRDNELYDCNGIELRQAS
jgi:hypothetical protein